MKGGKASRAVDGADRTHEFVRVRGAREHNLKNVDVDKANLDALEAVNFCDNIWPIARQGLELLRDNVFTGGGLGSRTIRWAIGTIIRIVNSRCGG
jgi:hypothetical protein